MKNNCWAREEAVKIISRVVRENAYANIAAKQSLDQCTLSRVDKALVTEIVNGTLRNLGRIDWIKDQFARTKKLSPWVEDILRCGIYQLLFLERVPDSAVCNESAELARKHGHEGAVKFVNGVLRNISRNKENLQYPDKDKAPVQYLSVFYSHPAWMVEKWLKDYGRSFTEELLEADNLAPAFTIRVNRLKASREEVMALLQSEGVECEAGVYNDEALSIRGTSAIEDKMSFKQGYYQVQDESSMLVARIVDPRPGERILDVCSAPGGKTTHMAERMENMGAITARDIHPQKLKLVMESCKRLGIAIVAAEVHNAKVTDEKSIGIYDRVLVDAPCSGLGVIGRKPDLRWKKSPEDFNGLAVIQQEILEASSRCVRPGGVLVYSTCTINKSENNQVVEAFLSKNADFCLESISKLLPEVLRDDATDRGYLSLYPNLHHTDGFFIARMRRKDI